MEQPSTPAVDFRGFGLVEVFAGGRPVDIGTPRQRHVLAALMADAGRPVSLDAVVDRVWGEEPPDSARPALYAYVARLRQVLGSVTPPVALVRRSGGYLLDVEPDAVDLVRFRALIDRAGPENRPEHKAELLREALGLYRGPALSGLGGDWAGQLREAIERQRLAAAVAWAEAELRCGNGVAAVGQLTDLNAQHPLAEPVAAMLMRALHAAGSRADALGVYASMRKRLVDELGAEPGPELREAHQVVLSDRPDSARQRAEVTVRPAQLPADVRGFAGRADHLATLDAMLARGTASPAVMIAAVWGTAGVGKSALTVRWAHSVASRFPGGQLYVNLRGFDPVAAPMPAAAALRGFLHALGVTADAMPSDLAAQTGLYRTLLAGRRVLVVLDNARDAGHVRPLLPGSAGNLVLVNSRTDLSGLVVSEGADPLCLDLLTAAEARDLLVTRLGQARVDAEPAAVAELIALCGRLPLALALVGARAVTRPGHRLADLAAEVRESPLAALAQSDEATDLRAVFSATYRALSPCAARLFRLFGLLTSPDVSAQALESLAGRPVPQTRAHLAELTSAQLLTETAPGRYGTHDLLRAYAGELAAAAGGEDNEAAVLRVLDYYAQGADRASAVLWRGRLRLPLPPASAGVAAVEVTGVPAAKDWLNAELAAAYAAIEQAAAWGHDAHATALSLAMLPTFQLRLGLGACWASQEIGLEAARRLGDRAAQARFHRQLGALAIDQREYGVAAEHIQRGLDQYRELDDTLGQAVCHSTMGTLYHAQGRFADNLASKRRALELTLESGRSDVESSNAYNSVAWAYELVGDHEQAVAFGVRAVALAEEGRDEFVRAHSLLTLGYAYESLRQSEQAIRCCSDSLDAFRRLGDVQNEAHALERLGVSHQGAGDENQARVLWQSALRIYDELGHQDAERVRDRLARVAEPRVAEPRVASK